MEPFLVAATLQGVVAQRLVRKTCGCGGGGSGCKCDGTGYLGRTALLEFLEVSEPIRAAISAREPAGVLEQMARTNGFVSLREAGERLVALWTTSPDELNRTLGAAS